MGSGRVGRSESNDWHTHPFDELCLVSDGECSIGHDDSPYAAPHGSLFLFRRGERHRFWNSVRQEARLWVLHYETGSLTDESHVLDAPDSKQRVWRMNKAQVRKYQDLFARLEWESLSGKRNAQLSESGCLQLLLAEVTRFHEAGQPEPTMAVMNADPQLMEFWSTLHEYSGLPTDGVAYLKQKFEQYDSLRHKFRHVFGCTPRKMVERLHLKKAQYLLLEREASVAALADELGWNRQHEFTRAFTREVGISPARWRRLNKPGG